MTLRLLIFGGLALLLVVVNGAILSTERLLSTGDVVLLELAPVDPRSLIQGDYMRLDYDIPVRAGADASWPRTGRLVVRLDSARVARFVRRHAGGALAPGERLLEYRMQHARMRIGSDAFFFQEGSAARYAAARYGELRVAPDGSGVLVGLRDAHLRPIR